MIIEVKYKYETAPKRKTITVAMVGVDGKEQNRAEVDAPNESWKATNYIEVDDNASAALVCINFTGHLIKTIPNIVKSSIKIKKLIKIIPSVKL